MSVKDSTRHDQDDSTFRGPYTLTYPFFGEPVEVEVFLQEGELRLVTRSITFGCGTSSVAWSLAHDCFLHVSHEYCDGRRPQCMRAAALQHAEVVDYLRFHLNPDSHGRPAVAAVAIQASNGLHNVKLAEPHARGWIY